MDEVMHALHEVGEAPLFLLIVISAVYSAFLAKFLSMNFVKGRHVHLHLHGGGLMKTGYTLMVSMLFLLLAVILLGIDEHVEEFVKAGFNVTSFMVGVLVTVAYAIGFVKPTLETKVGQVLADRFYLMALNDFIVPKIGWAFATAVDYGNRAIDFFTHRAIPGLFESVSKGIRVLQTGRLSHYVQLALGALMLLLIVVSVAGW